MIRVVAMVRECDNKPLDFCEHCADYASYWGDWASASFYREDAVDPRS